MGRLKLARLEGPSRGRWASRRSAGVEGLTEEQLRAKESLESIGYLDGVEAPPEATNVVLHLADRVTPVANLVTSAHAPTAFLLDMDGEVLHSWRAPYRKAFPDSEVADRLVTYWRRTFLLPGGDLLAIFEGQGLIRLTATSDVVWANDLRAHHDLHVLDDGSLWVLDRETRLAPGIHPELVVLEDFVTLLDADGTIQRRVSLLAALQASPWAHDWSDWEPGQTGDLMHTNTLHVLDGRIADVVPAFQAGNILLSSFMLDLIFVLDPETEQVVWAMEGDFRQQHDPQVLDNGNLLLFDNLGGGAVEGESSAVLELDPATGEVLWAYRGSPGKPFLSETCGLVQRLPDGHTLVTETDSGRAFEVTPEGEIVWEFYNPFRGGDEGQYIATLMEVARLPADMPLDWISGGR